MSTSDENEKSKIEKNKKKMEKLEISQETTNNPTDMEEWNNNPMLMTNSEIDEKYNIPKTRTRGFSLNTKDIVQNVLRHLSFQKHVRLQGVLILMLLLIISAGHFVVFHVFANTQDSYDYQQINTEFVWVFLAFSIIYFLRIIHILGTWKGTAKDLIKEKYDVNTNENVENEQATNVLSTIKSKYTACLLYTSPSPRD